jgi:succinate dehydrogenase / fumarate reductase cytochrome b subunit
MLITPPVSSSPHELEPDTRAPLLRRIFSLSGVVPLGAFLVLHVAVNARALHGDQAFASAAGALQRLPGLPVIEALFVFAPLLLHGAFGLWLVATRRPLVPSTPYPAALRLGMRASGVVVVAFLAMHLPELRFHAPSMRLDGAEMATRLDADLSATSHAVPWRGLAYLVGVACVTFHFAAGLWGAFAATDRGRASSHERRWAAWAAALFGAVILFTFANVVVFRATGAALFGGLQEDTTPTPACR